MHLSEPRRDPAGSAEPDEEESKMAEKKITPVAPEAKSASSTPDKAAARVSKHVKKHVKKHVHK